ncbi:hypothetical protein [Halalkalibacter akibai]|uniref:Uncharacterized protein n=1 Tax=Halalkalibacter akibai (strain ATCC 43226 / DSM 21942 / CIP 109018 / JCM 9157 / 1139) TaxID=1236973 RepID=W4QX93_HALA3|nr:hypothetical protein [Halalkalibacter akibai]GAE36517.1 hypothetical protein JCM9157_3710 [Halalkalibacter akibai JCM 9157]
MIQIDQTKRQILSNSCLFCQDEFFQPPTNSLPKVGCCSYSPTFRLLEIANMALKDPLFLKEDVLSHPKAEVFPFSVKVHANIHSEFHKTNHSKLTKIEREDLQLSYSVCQYFEIGCTLDPSFKNNVCRTFICLTIEDSLNEDQKKELQYWTKTFQDEDRTFQLKHEANLKKLGLDLINNPTEVIDYFQSISLDL